mgnify:CR=1 FL=1
MESCRGKQMEGWNCIGIKEKIRWRDSREGGKIQGKDGNGRVSAVK